MSCWATVCESTVYILYLLTEQAGSGKLFTENEEGVFNFDREKVSDLSRSMD
jgi:hypothetical protein